MKRLIFALLMVSILILAGCSTTQTTSDGSNSQTSKTSAKAICGNGIQESGETSETCCLDVPCSEFFSCKELSQGDKLINTCAKDKLEDTKEYKNLLEYWQEESMEYNKESDLINYDYILTKINQMNRSIEKLKSVYDVSTEELFIQYRYERRDWNVKRTELFNKISKESDEDKQKELYSQVITLDKGELERLNRFSDEQADSINTKFDYDIIERREILKSQIKEEEDTLDLANKKHEIQLSIIDYSPKCYDWGDEECFLEYAKIQIKNTGEIPLLEPTFDFYIQKGDSVISRDIDEYDYNLDEIPVGYDGVFKSSYVGYDSKESLPKGSYTLKVNLKQGVSTKVIATATTSITMR